MSEVGKILPVILSGGAGTRLWPLSRQLHPKQFHSILGREHTLLQETWQRVSVSPDVLRPLIVCNEEHRFFVAEQMREVGVENSQILLEPAGRNTAPAVTLAALRALQMGDPLLLVLPADHAIQDYEAFHGAVDKAATFAERGELVTFGITPTSPHTGYGYIQMSDLTSWDRGSAVKRFVEKPDIEEAKGYLQDGDYLWNSGMFIFKASTWIEEVSIHAPTILSACQQAMEHSTEDAYFLRPGKEEFLGSPSDSVDYAVMEKTTKAWIVPLDAGWSDVGSWQSLWEVGVQDRDGNICEGDTLVENVRNTFVHAGHRLVVAMDVEDLAIVETGDAILVMRRESDQAIKKVVKQLREEGRGEACLHRRVVRPWGTYETVDLSKRFQVKRITVNPQSSLSLQMHRHRAEHWVVVRGTAQVTCGEDEVTMSENESIFIPTGTKHRLENPGDTSLELIEVQSGSYLGEDDIVRFEDNYGR